MCGIIAYVSKNKDKTAGEHVLNQYQDQFSRGQKGFGLISVKPTNIVVKRATLETKAIIDLYNTNDDVQIFHHRLPTSTENKLNQTHPFFIEHDELKHDYVIVHNGVIRNADALMKTHTEELGYIYKTLEPGYSAHYNKFNDSEALAIEIARYFNGSSDEIGALGTIAFIALQLEKESKRPLNMIWARNDGNPIECLETENGFLLASSITDVSAELIAKDTFEILDLQKYFKSRSKIYDVYDAVESGEIKFKTPPAPATPTYGYGAHTPTATTTKPAALPASKPSTQEEDDMMEDIDSGYYSGPVSKRDAAFEKMADRIIDDISDDIHELMLNMAYNDIDDEVIEGVANKLFEALVEKRERAESVVRPHFDRMEDAELSRLVDEDNYQSLNERIDASTKRFNSIVF